jgi:hypothetical protein
MPLSVASSAQVAHELDVLFRKVPPAEVPEPFKPHNLFEHAPATLSVSSTKSSRTNTARQMMRRSSGGGATSARRIELQAHQPQARVSIVNFAAEQEAVSQTSRSTAVAPASSRRSGGGSNGNGSGGLRSSASVPSLLEPAVVTASPNGILRGLAQRKRVLPRHYDQPADQALLQAAARRERAHAAAVAAERARLERQPDLRRPLSPTRPSGDPLHPRGASWSEVMQLEAQLVAAQKQQQNQQMELQRMLAVSGALQAQRQAEEAAMMAAAVVEKEETKEALAGTMAAKEENEAAHLAAANRVVVQALALTARENSPPLHASRVGPARTFGGFDPLLSSQQQQQQQPYPVGAASSPSSPSSSPHDWASSILDQMFNGAHAQPHYRSPDALEAWRAAQAAHGVRSSPAAMLSSAQRAAADASSVPVPLQQLLSEMEPPVAFNPRPQRSAYALQLLQQQKEQQVERQRRMQQLAPPSYHTEFF